ncbi:MAG: nitroreductase [Spirochaetes bacterium RBG_13_51_14]|nr:MAG: nitroreductase [Spirochaetes bacterium RBG_13_51_14]
METLETIKTRRSVNYFESGKQIPVDKIKEIIGLANLAPSSFNLQPWEVVLVTDPERKKALRKCAFNQPKVEEASAMLIVIANPGAVEENVDRVLADWVKKGYMKEADVEKQRGTPFGLYGERASETRKIFAVKNAAFFAMNFMIAAKGMGYETHPMDGFNAAEVKREFGIPDDRIIPLLIAVGHLRPDQKLLPRAFRRDVDDFLRMNGYAKG